MTLLIFRRDEHVSPRISLKLWINYINFWLYGKQLSFSPVISYIKLFMEVGTLPQQLFSGSAEMPFHQLFEAYALNSSENL